LALGLCIGHSLNLPGTVTASRLIGDKSAA
jgi:hypothetical protein